MTFARRRLDRHKPVPVARHQCFHDRMIRPVTLQQDTTGPLGTAGSPGYLMKDLIGTFRRPQIATSKPEIRIDNANQRQQRKMVTLGHDLGADKNIDLAILHALDQRTGGGRALHRVARHYVEARAGEP